jgi:hypothetical protein
MGVPSSWESLFTSLKFQLTDWDFMDWHVTLHGIENVRSFQIARDIFKKIFTEGSLPIGIGSVDLYFRGNNAEIKLETTRPTKAGNYSRHAPCNDHALNLNQPINVFPIATDSFLRLKYTSPNVVVDYVEDLGSPRHDPVRYLALTKVNGIKGLLIDTAKKSPLKLLFKIALFAGNMRNCEVNVTW